MLYFSIILGAIMTDIETHYAGLSVNSLKKLHQGARDA
jgi:hypothetical protein